MELLEILRQVNIDSKDDGQQFQVTDRIRQIQSLLIGSKYKPLLEEGLSFLYAHQDFDPQQGFLLISSHIDSVYKTHFQKEAGEGLLLGTFDNSITNAVVVDLMRRDQLAPHVLVAFTGDEEVNSRGARQTIEFLIQELGDPELILVNDITAEGYGISDCTLENLVVSEEGSPRLGFTTREDLERCLIQRLETPVPVIPDAEPDETWDYAEYDQNCVTVCLPSAPHPKLAGTYSGEWMHSDLGVLIQTENLPGYSRALHQLCKKIT